MERVELVLIDLAPQVGVRSDELCVLDDAGIHVDQHQRAVRRVVNRDRAEQRIGGPHELRLRVCVLQLGEPLADDHLGAADDAPDRLVEEEIAGEVLRQPVAAVDLDPGGRGEVIEGSVRHADPVHAALLVGDAARSRPWHLEVGLEVVGDVERAVVNGRLKIDWPDLAATVDPPGLAVVVLGRPPLAAVRLGLFPQHLSARRDAQAERVVGHVEPVVHRPGEAAGLPLHVRDAADVRVEELFLVGDTVTVRVGVLEHVAVVGLEREDHAVFQREGHARHHHLVDEHGVLVVAAVAVGVLVPRDAADRRARVRTVGVLHVRAHLEHVHPAVAVEGHADGVLDERIGEDWLDAEAGRQQEPFLLFFRRQPQHGRPWAEIGAHGDLRVEPAATSARGSRRLLRRRGGRGRWRWRLTSEQDAARQTQRCNQGRTTQVFVHRCQGRRQSMRRWLRSARPNPAAKFTPERACV